MESVFLHLLRMSLSAAVLVVAVLLLRVVFCKAPRWIHCLLWALVAVRLLCPITVESDFSLMPDTSAAVEPLTSHSAVLDTVISNTPTVDTDLPDTAVTTPTVPSTDTGSVGGTMPTPNATPVVPTVPTQPDSSVAATGDSVDPWQVVLAVATQVWLLGMLAMVLYAAVTTLRLRLQVREAARVEGNLWQCDHLRSPFILGVLRPRIYLPSDLDAAAQASVIAHEKAHLRRLDHLWKPLGFLLLAVYWFNPFMWVAYILLCRDIEAACDERVVRDMTAADRKAYSEALLACSAPRRLITACPLAFGETSVKSRIKSVLSYKKPAIWIIVAALLVSTVAGVCLLTDPKTVTPSVTDEGDTTTTSTSTTTTTPPVSDPTVGETFVMGGFGVWKENILEEVYGGQSVRVFASYEEWDAFLNVYGVDDRYVKREDLTKFNADWFAENSLLMMYYTYYTCSAEPKVAAYTYTDGGAGLAVAVDVYLPHMCNDAVGGWHLFSGIQKTALQGVSKLTVCERAVIPTQYYVAVYTAPTESPSTAAESWREFLPSEEGWDLEMRMYEWENTGRWIPSAVVNRVFSVVAVIQMGGRHHYVADDYSALLRDDGVLVWLTDEEADFIRNLIAVAGEYRETNTTTSTTATASSATTTTTITTAKPTTSVVNKTASVIFTYTIKNNLNERQRQNLFGTSSVVAIKSFDALCSMRKTYGLGLSEYEYDAAFFQEYALLVTSYTTPNGSHRPTAAIYTYSENGSTLSVGLDEYQSKELVTYDIGEWIILSVIRQENMEEVTQFTSYVRAKLPDYSIALLTTPSATPQYATEKWSKAISVYEGEPLRDIIMSAWVIERVGLWDYPSDVLFDIKLVLKGSTYYYDLDKNILITGTGELVSSMSYTYSYRGMSPEGANLIRWCLARCSEDNEDLWFVASSHPTTEFTYSPVAYVNSSPIYYSRISLLNTAEMREIAQRKNWVANKERGRFYDAQYTFGGARYYVDFEHQEIVNEEQTLASRLTDAEMAYLRSVLTVDGWAARTKISGYVVESWPQKGYITLYVDREYADKVSGTLTVSLLYWTGEVPAAGTHITVAYDDFIEKDSLEETIWAWSIAEG